MRPIVAGITVRTTFGSKPVGPRNWMRWRFLKGVKDNLKAQYSQNHTMKNILGTLFWPFLLWGP